MKASLFSLFNMGLLFPAAGHCRSVYPSFTALHSSPFDFAGAQMVNAVPAAPEAGLFTIDQPGKSGNSRMTLESAPQLSLFPFNSLLLSAAADLPRGSSMSLEVKVLTGDANRQPQELRWSKWYRLGTFSSRGDSSSGDKQTDDDAELQVDELVLKRPGNGYKYRVTLETDSRPMPALRLVAVTYTDKNAVYDDKAALGAKDRKAPPLLAANAVPGYSQMTQQQRYARDICSPAAMTMLLGSWGQPCAMMDVAQGVYDSGAGIYGNWAFNTAYAGSRGLDTFVTRFNTVGDAEYELAHGRPFAASVTYGPGELKNSPIKKTRGHLVVVKGLNEKGDFLVNDPAAPSDLNVPRVYSRSEFAAAWLKNKYGLVYRMLPKFPRHMRVALPASDLLAAPPSAGKPDRRETQLLLGETVRVDGIRAGWAQAYSLEQGYYQSPQPQGWKGYPGWLPMFSLVQDDDYGYDYCVRVASATALVGSGAAFTQQPFYMGTRLLGLGKTADGRVKALIPGGRAAYIEEKDLLYYKDIPTGQTLRDSLIGTARLLLDAPYQWGGRTVAGLDCSGFINIIYRVHGMDVPRNASDQYLAAKPLAGKKLRKGDLVFLADQAKKDKITHVMLYAGDGQLLEAVMDPGKTRQISFLERLGKEPGDIANGELINGNKVYFAAFIAD